MAISRKAPKQDIRSITWSEGAAPVKKAAPQKASAGEATETLIQHHPVAELRRIAWISIPLLLALLIATYLESTKHWVIPFAQWLMKLGS